MTYSPVDYNFFGVDTVASGVGVNVSLALSTLGDEVTFLSYAGSDPAGDILRRALQGVANTRLLTCSATPQSVVLYDGCGKRMVYTDLKDVQELRVPDEMFVEMAGDIDAFCLTNINFSRSLLPLARAAGKPIFTDVHCLSAVDHDYDRDFMRYADVLFLSNEDILGREEAFVRQLAVIYPCAIIVVGMGDKGAMLYERSNGACTLVPAVTTRPVVNTVGAGDALFSAFVHFYVGGCAPLRALRLAVYFASYKIGVSGASRGFLSEEELCALAGLTC